MLLAGAIVKDIEEWFVICSLIDCGFVCIIGVYVYSTSEDRKVKFNIVFVKKSATKIVSFDSDP